LDGNLPVMKKALATDNMLPLASEVAPGELPMIFLACDKCGTRMTFRGKIGSCTLQACPKCIPFTPAPTEPQGAEAPEPMSQESISERTAMAYGRQQNICKRTRYSEHGSVGLDLFDSLCDMYNAGYAAAPRPQEPLAEVFSEFRRRFDQFSNYIPADDRAKYLLPALGKLGQLMLRPQEPRCPTFTGTLPCKFCLEITQCWNCPDDLWQRILPGIESHVCSECFMTEARRQGSIPPFILAQFFSPAQSPRMDFNTLNTAIGDLEELAEMMREQPEPTGFDHSIALRLNQIGQTLKSCEPAQSKVAAPEAKRCGTCGAIVIPQMPIQHGGEPSWNCLSCGATTKPTEPK
jgi:hypothetical protein